MAHYGVGVVLFWGEMVDAVRDNAIWYRACVGEPWVVLAGTLNADASNHVKGYYYGDLATEMRAGGHP